MFGSVAFGTTPFGAIPSAGAVTATISSAGGIASAQGVGTPTVAMVVAIVAAGAIASAEGVGSPSITTGAVATISSAGGIASAAAVGTPSVSTGSLASIGGAGGISSSEAIGSPSISTMSTSSITGAGGIASAASIGVPSVTVTHGASDEPVTVYEAKTAARLDSDDGKLDLYIEGVITAAREQAEQITGRVYKRRTFSFKLKDWPASGERLHVHEPSDCSITYWGVDGAWHGLDSTAYEYAASGFGAEVAPDLDTSWPVLGRKAVGERVRITFTAGPVSSAEVSESVKLYIKAQVTGWARNPSAVAARDFKASPLLDHLLDSEIVY